MPRTVRFHLDEHCSNALASGLRRLGIDVTTTADAGLMSAADEEQLDYALREGRVIYTKDADYLRVAALGVPHAGIAFCSDHDPRIGAIVRSLQAIWVQKEPHEMFNVVIYI